MFRAMFAALLTLMLVLPGVAHAKKPQLLSVWVLDHNGRPIPNAWVRIPGTEGRRAVSPTTGLWEASMLYTYDGRSVFFTKGLPLEITVSAPGYEAQTMKYVVRARRNEFDIRLKKMDAAAPTDIFEEGIELDWFKPLPGEEEEAAKQGPEQPKKPDE